MTARTLATCPTPLRSWRDLPGPRGLPLLGSALETDSKAFHRTLEAWYAKFGGTYTFSIGPKRFVVFGDTSTVRELLHRRPLEFSRGRHVEAIMTEIGIEGVFNAEGDRWRKMRKLVTSSFTPTQVGRFVPTMLEICDGLYLRWQTAAASGEAIDIQADLERFSMDVTSMLAFGYAGHSADGEADALRRDIDLVFPALARRLVAPIPYWRYFKLPRDRALDRALGRIRARLGAIILKARERLAREPERCKRPTTMLEAMLATWPSEDGGEARTDAEVLGNVMTILLAGEDTTAHSLAWAVHELSSKPAMRQRLRADLDQQFGERRRMNSLDDVKALPYLDGIIQETFRMRSVAPLMFVQAIEPTHVQGVELTPDVIAVVLTRTPGGNDSSFSEAKNFDPLRWMRKDEANVARCPMHDPKAMLAFGAGSRICPGRGLAVAEMHCVLGMLYRNFEVETLADPETVTERFSFTMVPVGLQVRLRARIR